MVAPVALGTAVLALVVALAPPLEAAAHESFVWHMAQHLLLTLAVAPLLLIGLPAALYDEGRRDLFGNRVVSLLTHPAVGFTGFAAVMWITHFSGLYDAALNNTFVHVAEHLAFLAAGLAFWTTVTGANPHRQWPWPARIGFLVAAIPSQSFLGLALYSADSLLYDAYASLDDQRAGALLMWLGGDAIMLGAAITCLILWLHPFSSEGNRAA